jgi:FkbM family methyltransferase
MRRSITQSAAAAALVRESASFFMRDLAQVPGIHVYRPRTAAARIGLRHRSFDRSTLVEVFGRRWYHPPAEVGAAIGEEPRQIVDLGANIGLFGALAARLWPQGRIVGYEPDPANFVVHARTITANGLAERWSVILAAAGVSDGAVSLVATGGPGSYLLAPGARGSNEVAVKQRDVLPLLSCADLVKVDIEGGEWAILTDPRFAAAPPRTIVLEYHPQRCPGADARTAAERLLAAAGMATRQVPSASRDGAGMVWGWLD